MHIAVSHALSRSFRDLEIETSVSNGKLLALLAAYGEVLEKRFDDDRVYIRCRLPAQHLGKLREPGTIVRAVGGELLPEPADESFAAEEVA